MERIIRKPFQGIINIIRFNWQYYLIAFILITILLFVKQFLPLNLNTVTQIVILLLFLNIFNSLAASFYIYDYSDLYSLKWLNVLNINANKQLVNISAGFDETSLLLTQKYSDCKLAAFDFYDTKKHTEISIKRARKAYPAFPGTKKIKTNNIALKANFANYIFLIFAAHEIRKNKERVIFFQQLKDILCADGKIIVVEHQRDIYNFLAYNLGCFHFFSKKAWRQTFIKAGLIEDREIKITPFVSMFILKKNGITP